MVRARRKRKVVQKCKFHHCHLVCVQIISLPNMVFLSMHNSQSKKKNATPLSSGKKKPRTIDLTTSDQLGASAGEKLKRELKYDTDMDPRTNALALYEATTNNDTLDIATALIPWLTEVSENKTGEIVIHRTPANHNLLSPRLSLEITNNIYKNAMKTDLTNNKHNESMGKDIHCLLTYNEKVRLATCAQNVDSSTIREEWDRSRNMLTNLSLLLFLIFLFTNRKKKGNQQRWAQQACRTYEDCFHQRY